MPLDLDGLKITESELEDLMGLALSDVVMSRLYRFSVFQDYTKLISLILQESLMLGLTLVISLPMALMITNKLITVGSESQLLGKVVQITLGLSSVILIVWNGYMIRKAKPLETIAKLVQEVEKYNEVIQALGVIDQLTQAGNLPVNFLHQESTLEALKVTKESLICALRTERILRENEGLIGRRYELFANLENNLAALIALDVRNQASEYGQLLNEALEIGLSVQKEIRKLR